MGLLLSKADRERLYWLRSLTSAMRGLILCSTIYTKGLIWSAEGLYSIWYVRVSKVSNFSIACMIIFLVSYSDDFMIVSNN